ncbi:MFS transporter [Glutamicibacter sp. MNS18]|uniref:MFS transporter n=1 Tax=Glutamicibacter sp. MNS18 TaxID=2989817 RepID=UPI002236AA8E|nr:MFS transporter [Glutamicibacter sp. MNS18]MCW4465968.1 MFS transporter [Glutamicibacter sp. MNS18]
MGSNWVPALRILRPFARRDYRILACALALSILAHGMWAVAMVYQVRQLGGGPTQLSMVATASALGLILLVLAGGIAADRYSCRRILIWVETVSVLLMSTTALLALTGTLQLWHLVITGFISGAGAAFFYPAYSALLPRMLPGEELLAANGVEGTMRPAIQTALGPMTAGVIVAWISPAHAIAGVALAHLAALLVLRLISRQPVYDRIEGTGADPSPATAFQQLREGVDYTLGTPWLLWTLIFAVVAVFTFIGPFEVLLPFEISDRLDSDATGFAMALAAYGVGCALGSVATASFRLPRRYLTVMMACWGLGSLPLAWVGVVPALWWLFPLLFIVGLTDGIGQVTWGTLLQRRVPRHLLGRISSLDFFVSLALMPVSMAVAGPLSEVVSTRDIFIVAGLASPILALVAWICGRFWRDELDHPLDRSPAQSLSTPE